MQLARSHGNVATEVLFNTRGPVPVIVPADQVKPPLTRTVPVPVIVPNARVRLGIVTSTPAPAASVAPTIDSVPAPVTVGLPLMVNVLGLGPSRIWQPERIE